MQYTLSQHALWSAEHRRTPEEGIVYVLTNEAMPGYVKIGHTDDIAQRLRSLDTTGVPLPHECFFACLVDNAYFVERQLHETFADRRVRTNREWFLLEPEQVVAALRIAAVADVTPFNSFGIEEPSWDPFGGTSSRRSPFDFLMVGIFPGETLTFVHNAAITCEVVDAKKVLFDGEITSLSAAAKKVLGKHRPVQGPMFWRYEGETLYQRRLRIEKRAE